VINQFGVEGNPRYIPDDYTYCNTFAGDVARAMGTPLPTKEELLELDGDRATVGAADLYRWFTTESAAAGWQAVDVSTPAGLRALQTAVNAGRPAFGTDPGHIVVVRPGPWVDRLGELRIAQAGAALWNDVPLNSLDLQKHFRPRFFLHD